MSLIESNPKNKFWELKPYWCQPWSIITFGILVLVSSWKIFNNILISLISAFFIMIWWVLFLIIAPISYEEINNKK